MSAEGELTEYKWVVVFGAIAALSAAFGIGANDVANAYATSVGSKALTIKQACCLALIFEFAGAVLAGSTVANTIRKGIADSKCFEDNYMDAPLLMYGNMCVVTVVAFWLVTATKLEMPVSTTHSCVGGMIGMAIAIKGTDCVVWHQETGEDNLWIPSGVVGIVISWFISPLLSAFFAVLMFLFVRTFILRSKNAFSRALKFYPVLIFLAVWINVFFIISKGISKKICPKEDGDNWLCRSGTAKKDGKVKGWVAMGFAAAISLVITIMCYPFYGQIRKWVEADFAGGAKPWYAVSLMGQPKAVADKVADISSEVKVADISSEVSIEMLDQNRTSSYIEVAATGGDDQPEKQPEKQLEKKLSFTQRMSKAINHATTVDVHESGMTSDTVTNIHENAERFDDEAEAVFRYIQIFTAICDSFAHGANDVANAMGPFMAIYALYHSGEVGKKSDSDDDAYWILALGGLGIGLGLLLYGYKIIRAIGVKLAKVTPSRGFAIELGAAIVIIIGSYLGLPLSTTHCQVGATTGVALLEGGKGINWKVLGITGVGWVATLVIAGVGAGLLTAQGMYAPLAPSLQDTMENEQCADWAAATYDWLETNTTTDGLYYVEQTSNVSTL